MAVAPPRYTWLLSSRPPGRYGGNMDFNKLTAGATLYLPVFHRGGQFFTGDSHAVQADGEVNGTAIEASLTGTFQFIVHKGAGRGMKWPRAEDATHYYTMGLDLDLDRAMREATQQTVDFLREKNFVKPLSPERLADFKDLPAVAETLPGFVAGGWNVLLAPIGTPEAIVRKASADLNKALDDATLKAKYASLGAYLRPMTPAQVIAFAQEQQRLRHDG
jgi:hypothetical protein